VLSPLLFLIFIADIEEYLQNGTSISGYADDTINHVSANTKEEVLSRLEKEAVIILEYMAMNRLAANESKTQLMIVGKTRDSADGVQVGNSNIKCSEHLNILGIILDSDLSFKKHTSDLETALDQRIGVLRRLTHHVPANRLGTVAEGLCISKIRYGLPVFGVPRLNNSDPVNGSMARLQRKQNEVMRIITNTKRKDKVSIETLLEETHMTSVNHMITTSVLGEMSNLTNGGGSQDLLNMMSRETAPCYSTRSIGEKKLQVCRPMSTFLYNGPKLWNNATQEIRNSKQQQQSKRLVKQFVKQYPI
jgi:hypothetical protein